MPLKGCCFINIIARIFFVALLNKAGNSGSSLAEDLNFETGGALSSISLTTERSLPLSNSLHVIYPVLCSVFIYCNNFRCLCINFV